MDKPPPIEEWEKTEALKEYIVIQTDSVGPVKVSVPCQYRAKYYSMHLKSAYDAFHADLNAKSNCNFIEVHQQLITYLATILDEQVVVALDNAFKKNPQFKKMIYPENRDQYIKFCEQTEYSTLENENKGLFRTNDLVTKNFIRANLKMFERIHRDFDLLCKALLSKLKTPILTKATATGSDFHKEGQQVIILTYTDNISKKSKKIVYKPSPVQADALLIGDVQKLKTLKPGYEGHFSLIELLNDGLSTHKKIPVYSIIPMNDSEEMVPLETESSEENITLKTEKIPINLNSHYGYLEYLTHEPWELPDDLDIIKFCINKNPQLNDEELQKEAQTLHDNFFLQLLNQGMKIKECDFITTKKTDVNRYSYECGLLAFIMVISGIIDNHCQNLLICMLRPLLLDTEVCLAQMLPDIYNQLCFDRDGSMYKKSLSRKDHIVLTDINGIKNIAIRHREKNILFYFKKNIFMQCAPNSIAFMEGFNQGIKIFQQSIHSFKKWFHLPNVKNMLIRVPLHSTNTYANEIKVLKQFDFSIEEFNDIRKHRIQFDKSKNSYATFLDDATASSIFQDFISLNIPVYYAVANQCHVFNAHGNLIMVPKDMENLSNPERIPFFEISSLEFIYNASMKVLENPSQLIADTQKACLDASKEKEPKKHSSTTPDNQEDKGEICRIM